MDNSPQVHEIVESYFFRVSFLPPPPRDSLSECLERHLAHSVPNRQSPKLVAEVGMERLKIFLFVLKHGHMGR